MSIEKSGSETSEALKPKNKGLLGRLGKFAAARDVKVDSGDKSEALGVNNIDKIVRGLQGRTRSAESLGHGKATRFADSVKRSPLAFRDTPEGMHYALTHLIFVGDSVMGVSTTWEGSRVDELALLLLPIGAQANDHSKQYLTARSLLKIRPDEVSKPGPDGVVMPWRQVDITRKGIGAPFGINDDMVSRNHGRVDLMADSRIEVNDNSSSNGTEVMTINSLANGIDGFKMSDNSKSAALELVGTLQSNPDLWSNEAADVISFIRL